MILAAIPSHRPPRGQTDNRSRSHGLAFPVGIVQKPHAQTGVPRANPYLQSYRQTGMKASHTSNAIALSISIKRFNFH
jgi:hypothetical protein